MADNALVTMGVLDNILPYVKDNILSEASQPSDTNQLSWLIETDMLPAVYDTNGKILTDENSKIILRY